MGIPGLINAIGPGERISLAKLAVTHLERTARPMRIAVDISIWLFQVQAGQGGRNPELRTLFYRLLRLLALPVHPLFVYDGPQKPSFKRGKAVSARSGSAPLIRRSKDLVERFKFPWHEAPGEAEAECARLQQAGVVDAVMSNDVDALMFGSSLTIMNFSKENGSGTSSATHVTCYARGQDGYPSNIPLGRPDMILFAMLSGGDYLPAGVEKCGSGLAAEIAKAEFGQDLLKVLSSPTQEREQGLKDWRERLQYELEENLSGYFKVRHKAVRIPDAFPDLQILEYYTRPKVSNDDEMEFLRNRLRNAWDQDIDPLAIRSFAADQFQWNYRTGAYKVVKLLAEPLISYRLRLQRPSVSASPGFSFVSDCPPSTQKVYKSRTSFGTDATPELQFDMLPADVVGLDLLAEELPPPLATPESMSSQNSVHEGVDDDDLDLAAETAPQTPSKPRVTKKFDPFTLEKVWIFETVARLGVPEVVKKWEKEQAEKAAKAKEAAAKKKTGSRRAAPKKKGPIDSGMKRGSILKYGVLTKERSELSTSKQAHLLEAATSVTSSKNPLAMVASGSASSSPILLDQEDDRFSSPSMYTQQGASPAMRYVSQQVDDLLESFNSMCNLSPSSNTKRHHITEQSRLRPRRGAMVIDGVDFEDSETLSATLNDSPTGPKGLKISYSSGRSFDERRSAKKLPAPSSPSKKSRAQLSKAFKPQLEEEKNEVRDIEKAIESLSLSLECDNGHDETILPRPMSQSSPKKTTQEPKRRTRSSKTEIAEPSQSPRKVKADLPCAANSVDPTLQKSPAFDELAVPLKTKTRKSNGNPEASKPKMKPPRKHINTDPKYETKGHVENIVLHDGFWSIDPSPSTQDSHEDPTRVNSESTTRRQAQGSKKKRLPRVSILDLV